MSFSLGMASASITAVAARTKSKQACTHIIQLNQFMQAISFFVLLNKTLHVGVSDKVTDHLALLEQSLSRISSN
jgi:hypothetical protein